MTTSYTNHIHSHIDEVCAAITSVSAYETLAAKNVAALKAICKDYEITGYSRLRKAELIESIRSFEAGALRLQEAWRQDEREEQERLATIATLGEFIAAGLAYIVVFVVTRINTRWNFVETDTDYIAVKAETWADMDAWMREEIAIYDEIYTDGGYEYSYRLLAADEAIAALEDEDIVKHMHVNDAEHIEQQTLAIDVEAIAPIETTEAEAETTTTEQHIGMTEYLVTYSTGAATSTNIAWAVNEEDARRSYGPIVSSIVEASTCSWAHDKDYPVVVCEHWSTEAEETTEAKSAAETLDETITEHSGQSNHDMVLAYEQSMHKAIARIASLDATTIATILGTDDLYSLRGDAREAVIAARNILHICDADEAIAEQAVRDYVAQATTTSLQVAADSVKQPTKSIKAPTTDEEEHWRKVGVLTAEGCITTFATMDEAADWVGHFIDGEMDGFDDETSHYDFDLRAIAEAVTCERCFMLALLPIYDELSDQFEYATLWQVIESHRLSHDDEATDDAIANPTDQLAEALEAAGLKRWTKGSMDRMYANPSVYGVEYDYYKTGNIRSCTITIDGDEVRVSNAEGARFKSTKAYVDLADASVHVKTTTDYEEHIAATLKAIVVDAIATITTTTIAESADQPTEATADKATTDEPTTDSIEMEFADGSIRVTDESDIKAIGRTMADAYDLAVSMMASVSSIRVTWLRGDKVMAETKADCEPSDGTDVDETADDETIDEPYAPIGWLDRGDETFDVWATTERGTYRITAENDRLEVLETIHADSDEQAIASAAEAFDGCGFCVINGEQLAYLTNADFDQRIITTDEMAKAIHALNLDGASTLRVQLMRNSVVYFMCQLRDSALDEATRERYRVTTSAVTCALDYLAHTIADAEPTTDDTYSATVMVDEAGEVVDDGGILVDAEGNIADGDEEVRDTTTKAYSTISEVETEVIATLGDLADQYDTEGIALEISGWDEDGRLVADIERDDYWHIVAQYAC